MIDLRNAHAADQIVPWIVVLVDDPEHLPMKHLTDRFSQVKPFLYSALEDLKYKRRRTVVVMHDPVKRLSHIYIAVPSWNCYKGRFWSRQWDLFGGHRKAPVFRCIVFAECDTS